MCARVFFVVYSVSVCSVSVVHIDFELDHFYVTHLNNLRGRMRRAMLLILRLRAVRAGNSVTYYTPIGRLVRLRNVFIPDYGVISSGILCNIMRLMTTGGGHIEKRHRLVILA